jgi:hypothetical protein
MRKITGRHGGRPYHENEHRRNCRLVPGGRPLRRRREMVSIYGRPRLRGTAAPTDLRRHERKAIAGQFPGGRPL